MTEPEFKPDPQASEATGLTLHQLKATRRRRGLIELSKRTIAGFGDTDRSEHGAYFPSANKECVE